MISSTIYSSILLCMFPIVYETIISSASGQHIRVSVEPQKFLEFNGLNITDRNLHHFLEEHEKLLLFGRQRKDNDHKRTFQIFNVRVNHNQKSRSQRSTESNIVNLQINDEPDRSQHNGSDSSDATFNIKLHKSEKLFDDSFVFIARDENRTSLVDDFDKLVEKYANCFYRNENSAIDLCDGNMRGILHHKSRNLIIHPLPHRFGSSSHIAYESDNAQVFADMFGSTEANDNVADLLLFEPELSEFEPNESNNSAVRGHGHRTRRRTIGAGSNFSRKIPQILYVETAIFVDKDLFRHMAKNFPKNTEGNLIRFVLAMINGVQLLYHHPSLGYRINFMLKRLEILHTDPKELRRSSDIDVFLNSFCLWQRKFNPTADDDIVHFDHAVILTGLDLYVVSKKGKVSSQVVGLAPVAGMCTTTSSCTINEGKHFESVFVVAHEIGHNLGMRHDTSENNCDPSLFIMSPTLGSGKITWSKCSQNYLKSFLETSQAKCLFDQSVFDLALDHTAEGMLPGERFDADQQCMLKYGKDSIKSTQQPLKEICRDLHCQRDRYTWTSHPALEGTNCGESKWCRSGVCVLRTTIIETSPQYTRPVHIGGLTQQDKSNLIDDRKFENLMKQEYPVNRTSIWNNWSDVSECESGCLYGESGRLRDGSTGLKTFRRTCREYRYSRKKCYGPDKKYEACTPKQCYNVPRITLSEFGNQICERAKKFDSNIRDQGIQKISNDPEESCKVYCATKSGEPITKSWTYPDGTMCQNQESNSGDNYFCVNGRCERFSCNDSASNYFKDDAIFCLKNSVREKTTTESTTNNVVKDESSHDYKGLRPSAASLVHHILVPRNVTALPRSSVERHATFLHKNAPSTMEKLRNSLPKHERLISHVESPLQWVVKSGCHFSCMEQSSGIQVVASIKDRSMNIQLCQAQIDACDKLQTTREFAAKLCKNYQSKVRGLSGYGMQISPSANDPDRGCKVACQDEYITYRFYLVNGEQGYFPFGTKCSRSDGDKRYCVNGKCLEFDENNIPFVEPQISLAHYRSKRKAPQTENTSNDSEPIANTSNALLEAFLNDVKHLQSRVDAEIDEGQIDMQSPVQVPIHY